MNSLWRRIFFSLTKGADFKQIIFYSACFAGIATLVTLPYFHYLIKTVARGSLSGAIPGNHYFLFFQLALMFVICLLSAVTGFMFGKRYALPGLGSYQNYKQDMPWLIATGAVLMGVSYVVFDRFFYTLSPGSYPGEIGYLLVIPFKGAIAEELILRFGLVTIGVGICRNRYAGVALVSVFATIMSIRYFTFVGIDIAFSYIFVVQVLLTFLVNCILGYLFVSRGLLHAMTVKWVIGWKYMLVALLKI